MVLTMLLAAQAVAPNGTMTNDELERIWKELLVAPSKVPEFAWRK
jgi:hypothetical protein